MYPKLVVDTKKVEQNTRVITRLCAQHGIRVCGVTKGVCGDPHIAKAFVAGGVHCIGDSRLDDLAKLQGAPLPKLLIRMPHPSEADRVVRLADISTNTELATIQALDAACKRAGGLRHGIMLMCDLGDLREGFVDESDLFAAARAVVGSQHLYLHGIGANLNCLSFILPDAGKMEQLASLARRMKAEFGLAQLDVSGGNSSNLNLLQAGGMPSEVNILRLGEALLLGRERATYQYLPGTFNDAFVFKATIIELKEKPSMPWGTAGADSFGHYHAFVDRGPRLRAIAAFGSQDTQAEVLWPLDEGIEVVDSSSDHTVLDLTQATRSYQVGDTVDFRCGYHAIDHAFTSQYVEKVFL